MGCDTDGTTGAAGWLTWYRPAPYDGWVRWLDARSAGAAELGRPLAEPLYGAYAALSHEARLADALLPCALGAS